MIRSCLSLQMVWNRQGRRVNYFPKGITLSILAGQKSALQQDGGAEGSANDWEMWADLKKQLKFHEEIALTSLRPDIVL